MSSNVLVIGSEGQIGTELCLELEKRDDIVLYRADIRLLTNSERRLYRLDATDQRSIKQLIRELQIDEVYLMAALLSAKGEENPKLAWELNMNSLLHLLDLAKEGLYKKLFWPSSIAVFGPDSPKVDTPQNTTINPSTVYGISKRSGEFWCNYYFNKYGVDVRSIRYPGLISHATEPGGGTTDYSVAIIREAISTRNYTCYLKGNTVLPMLFMQDAIKATLAIMDAPKESITIRTSYNLGGFKTSPELMARSIRRFIPDFEINYSIDFRQDIADSWPQSINDENAIMDWGFESEYDLDRTVEAMIKALG
ncbi:MAG: NAD-dependent epimerase/dehydratase family protein [Flavobacteriaceae bacterium]|nr:NAD-dependent epimerase/dehydratase family protein [Flavobacteriaceae bacterium]